MFSKNCAGGNGLLFTMLYMYFTTFLLKSPLFVKAAQICWPIDSCVIRRTCTSERTGMTRVTSDSHALHIVQRWRVWHLTHMHFTTYRNDACDIWRTCTSQRTRMMRVTSDAHALHDVQEWRVWHLTYIHFTTYRNVACDIGRKKEITMCSENNIMFQY